MVDKGTERRLCRRIKIPGTTIIYLESRSFFLKKKFNEELFPVIEISRGGVRFVGQRPFTPNRRISMKISIPEENSPLILQGEVRWSALNPTLSYKYQIGVQFNPYGKKKGNNDPEVLERIITLEDKLSAEDKSSSH